MAPVGVPVNPHWLEPFFVPIALPVMLQSWNFSRCRKIPISFKIWDVVFDMPLREPGCGYLVGGRCGGTSGRGTNFSTFGFGGLYNSEVCKGG